MEAKSESKNGSPPNGVTVAIPDFSHLNGHHRPEEKPLIPEYLKTLWAWIYMNTVAFAMSYATTVTHIEAPDRNIHPPLPDRMMDNLPNITWGTPGSEVCIMTLGITLIILLVFHKHRTIVFRRFCVILATVFMMRISTMLSTALPVLPPPSECSTEHMETVYQRLTIAFSLWLKSGARISGIKMCGDYMFSGHITSLTVGNLMICEYSPKSFYLLRYIAVTTNIVGAVLMIIGRGHYTVDVIIAMFLVFLVFNYYHTLINLYVFTKRTDKLRWFPFFRYFESNVCAIVPNEFEIPRVPPSLLKYLSWKK